MSLASDFEQVIKDLHAGRPLDYSNLRQVTDAIRKLEDASKFKDPTFEHHMTNRSNPHLLAMPQLAGGPSYNGQIMGVNLVKNYPSLELADGAAPMWWETVGTVTLTEEDKTGESLPADTPNERVLKAVTGQTFSVVQQQWYHGNERLLMPSTSKVSFGCFVYLTSEPTGTGLRIQLADSVDGHIDDVNIKSYGELVYVNLPDIKIGANALRTRFIHSDSGATYYIINPTLNVGPAVLPWRPRGLVYRAKNVNIVAGVDPGGGSYTLFDLTSASSPNAFLYQIKIVYSNSTTANRYVFIRPYNKSSLVETTVGSLGSSVYARGFFLILSDDQQRMEYDTDAAAGDSETLYINQSGYWEWE